MTKTIVTDEEILEVRLAVTDFYHSVEETPMLLAFSGRLIALVRRRLAERFRTLETQAGNEGDTEVHWAWGEAARIVESDE